MKRRCTSLLSSIGLLLAAVAPLRAVPQELPGEEPPPVAADDEPAQSDRTPPRLSHIDGQASFWREGAEDWTQARVNTPLAPGDQLHVENASNLELQIGPRDFVRAASNSQLAFDNQERDYQQFRLTSGQASVDLRGLRPGETVEVDTPNGAFTIDRNGYYRVEVDDDATHFATRRGGRATVTPADGEPEDIASSEEVVVRGDDVESYAASEPDAWDRWNYERSDQLIDAVSYRHVPEEVYGVDDLDHNGRWRVVPRYGSVWFPSGVAAGWAPYSTGRWVHDPYYGWSWIDDASWGWAPFHYGRWVFVDNYWGWAPGPIVVRPYYAPALVAFFSIGPVSFGINVGAPALGWTALGWGEPCRPWWGPANYIGRPRWFGWGGPRVTINQTTINNINVYQNTRVNNGMVFVNRNEFARVPVERARLRSFDPGRLRAIDGALPVNATAARFVGGAARAQRPPQAVLDRRVVATRASAAPSGGGWFRRSGPAANPPSQIVQSPREARARGTLQRPRFGEQAGVERAAPPPLPRFDDVRAGRSSRLQEGTSSRAAPSPRSATARGGPRRGVQQDDRSPTPNQPPAVSPSQGGVDRRAPQGAMTRRSEPRGGSPRAQARSTQSPPSMQSPPRMQPPAPPEASQRRGSPRLDSPRRGRETTAQRAQPAAPSVARELPGQPANRVWAGRSLAGPAAPNATPRNAASPRNAQPQRAAMRHPAPQQVAPQQQRAGRQAPNSPQSTNAPDAPQANAGPQGRGHRMR